MPKTKEIKTIEVEVEDKAELAQVENTALADSPKWEEASTDILIGRINVKGKSSGYDAGDFGDLVIKQENVIVKDGHKAQAVVVSAVKAWREKTPFGSGVRGRIARTEEEAQELIEENKALGDRGFKVVEFADITMLVKQSDECEDDEGFEVPIGDDQWAIGKIDVSGKGRAFTYKALKTFQKLNPTASLVAVTWELYTKQEQWDKKIWWVPILKSSKHETSQEVLDWVSNFKQGV